MILGRGLLIREEYDEGGDRAGSIRSGEVFERYR
jgi:hypothetical protein